MKKTALPSDALVRATSSIRKIMEGGVADVQLSQTLNQALHFGQSAPQELQDFLEAVSALLSWSLVNDKKNMCTQCVPALQESALVYLRNTGGSKPSALWCSVAMKFVEKWKDVQARLERNPKLWQLDVTMDLFNQTEFLFPVDGKAALTTAILKAVDKFFASWEAKDDAMVSTVLDNYVKMVLVEIQANRGSRSLMQMHLRSIVRLATRMLKVKSSTGAFFSLMNARSSCSALALSMVGKLVSSGSPDVLMELSNCLLDNEFFAAMAECGIVNEDVNLILANIGTSMSPKNALAFWKRRHPGIIKDVVSRYELGTMRFFLKLASPKEGEPHDESIWELLSSVAQNCLSSNMPVAREVIFFMVEQSDVMCRQHLRSLLFALPVKRQMEIYNHCLEHIKEAQGYAGCVTLIIEKYPELLSPELSGYIFDRCIERCPYVFPLYRTILVKTKKQLNVIELELLVTCCGNEIWSVFRGLIDEIGLSAFEDGCESVFLLAHEKTPDFQQFVDRFVKLLYQSRTESSTSSTEEASTTSEPQNMKSPAKLFPFPGMELLEFAFGSQMLLHLPYAIDNNALEELARFIIQRYDEQKLSCEELRNILRKIVITSGQRQSGFGKGSGFGWGSGSSSGWGSGSVFGSSFGEKSETTSKSSWGSSWSFSSTGKQSNSSASGRDELASLGKRLVENGLTSHLLETLRQGNECALSVLLELPWDPALEKDIDQPATFMKNYIIDSNPLVYEYAMKALCEKAKAPSIAEKYRESQLSEVIGTHVHNGVFLSVDVQCIGAIGLNLMGQRAQILVKILTESKDDECVEQCINLILKAAFQKTFTNALFQDAERVSSLIINCSPSLWPKLKELLLSLQAPGELYQLFTSHRTMTRFVELFAPVVVQLVSLVETEQLLNDCVESLAIADEKDATVLFQFITQAVDRASAAVTEKLLVAAMQTTSKRLQSQIFDRLTRVRKDVIDAFVAQVVNTTDVFTLPDQSLSYSNYQLFQHGHLVDKLVFTGSPMVNAIVQLCYNIRSFRAFILQTGNNSEITLALKLFFALIELSKNRKIDISEERIPFKEIEDISTAYPDHFKVVPATETATFEDLKCDCLMVRLASLEKVKIPKDPNGNFCLSGYLLRGDANVTCALSLESCDVVIREDRFSKVYGGLEESLLSSPNVVDAILFYSRVEKNPVAYSVSEELRAMVNSRNQMYSQSLAILSSEVAKMVRERATPKQQVAFFFNVYLRGFLRSGYGEWPFCEQITNDITASDLMPLLDRIVWCCGHLSNVAKSQMTRVISNVFGRSSISECIPIIDRLSGDFLIDVTSLISAFCSKGPEAVAYCNTKEIGQRMCKIAVDMTKSDQSKIGMSDVFQALTYFPVPEISDLFCLISKFKEERRTGDLNQLNKLLLFAAFSDITTLEDLEIAPTDPAVMEVLIELLVRQRYEDVAKFIDKHQICHHVVDTLGPNIMKYQRLFLEYPGETICQLLCQQHEKSGLGVVCEMVAGMTEEQRHHFSDLVIKSMNKAENKRPFLVVLSALGKENNSKVGQLFQEAGTDKEALSVLWNMVKNMDPSELKQHMNILLGYILNGNIDQLGVVLPAVDDGMAGMKEWPSIVEQLKESDPQLTNAFIKRVQQFPSFQQMVHDVLCRPDEYMDGEFLEVIMAKPPTQDTLDLFMLALNGVLRSDQPPLVQRVVRSLIENGMDLDYTEIIIDIPTLLDYGSHHTFDDNLIEVVKRIVTQNKDFDAMLRDEIRAQGKSANEAPETFELEMRLYAQNTDEMIAIFKRCVAPLQQRAKTVARLLNFLFQQKISALKLTQELFCICPVIAPVERFIFKAGLSEMTPDARVVFAKEQAKSINPVSPRTEDVRKLYFLVKRCEPTAADSIRRASGIDRKKAILLAGMNPENRKYCVRLYDLSPDEITDMKHSGSCPSQISPESQHPAPRPAFNYFAQIPQGLQKKSQSQHHLSGMNPK